MKQLKQQFVDSWHELRKTKVMAVAAMLIAIGVILGFFSVQLTEFIRIGFSGIIIVRFNWEESWQPKLRLLYL